MTTKKQYWRVQDAALKPAFLFCCWLSGGSFERRHVQSRASQTHLRRLATSDGASVAPSGLAEASCPRCARLVYAAIKHKVTAWKQIVFVLAGALLGCSASDMPRVETSVDAEVGQADIRTLTARIEALEDKIREQPPPSPPAVEQESLEEIPVTTCRRYVDGVGRVFEFCPKQETTESKPIPEIQSGIKREVRIAQERDHENFTRIHLYAPVDLIVEVGGDYSVSLEGEKRAVNNLLSRVANSALFVSTRDEDVAGGLINNRSIVVMNGQRFVNGKAFGDLVMHVTLPMLSGLSMAGAGNATITALDSRYLELSLAGAGDIDARGQCGRLSVRLAGAGDVHADDLICSEVDVIITGSGDVDVHARNAADLKILGAGDISVKGAPGTVNRHVSGAGDITIH